MLGHEYGADIKLVAIWDPKDEPFNEIQLTPAGVLLQDFTGVPAVIGLAVMRDAIDDLGSNSHQINPFSPLNQLLTTRFKLITLAQKMHCNLTHNESSRAIKSVMSFSSGSVE